jgi:hypothetical protein
VVKLTNEATGEVIERKPFLDGSLQVRDLIPGPYELEVSHPNLTLPIDRRKIRLFPQPAPTFVPIPVPEDLFRDSPIRDIPDADLGPIQQAASSARDRLQPVAGKGPGEAIRAADWNTLVGAMVDLSTAVLQLTALVSPRGHDHPEIAEKIDEVQGNLRRFAEAYGRSLLELRREIETQSLRRNLTDVLDLGGANDDLRQRLVDRVSDLDTKLQVETPVFTQKLANTGSVILTAINEMAVAKGAEADTFLANPAVMQLAGVARQYSEAGSQTRPESELQTYVRTSSTTGGKLTGLIR